MFFKKKEKPQAPQITDATFNEMVTNTDQGILLDFYADWCGPCKMLSPIVDELSEEFKGRAIIGKINVDKNPQLSTHFKVKSIPTLVFIKNKQVLEVLNGLVPKPNLQEMVEDLIAYEFDESEEE